MSGKALYDEQEKDGETQEGSNHVHGQFGIDPSC
jgi:hypothetical protein